MLILIDDLDQSVTTKSATPVERIVSYLRASKLDREIASGASPEATVSLALRAQALVRPSMRRALARRVEELLEEATSGRTQQFAGVRISVPRDRILDAADALQTLVDHLRAAGPVPARGVALVRVLLTDGAGPLYYPDGIDDLTAIILDAVQQLEPLSSW